MTQQLSIVRETSVKVPNGEAFTPGKMYRNGAFFCQVCEDQDRFLEAGNEKVYARTAIPRGRYRVITSFSNRFQKVLPEVLGVPGFKGIRIHGGNRAEDSEGCILAGKVRTPTGIAQCADTVSRIIELIDSAADNGEDTYLEIT